MTIFEKIVSAVKVVLTGGVIVYPTDTVYGIGCDPFNVEAVKRVYEIKKRERKPMPVLLPSLDMLYSVADPTPEEIEAALRLWPGPVTILMRKNPNLPDIVTAGEPSVGVRIPAHMIPLSIMEKAGKPLVGTSANISGQPSATEVKHIDESVLTKVDIVIDQGATFHKLPSTVVRVKRDGFEVVREGAMTAEEVARRLKA
ncbi:MAG: L-threonylcarbamoyladenylate synthase [Candidatus Caldarchaeum sp.]|nr:L-threonylcarbamoyladenylate synthase [Candidatus Caldarchaeum sp.]MCX8201457.1 L-threonylcarbamoyladenylate synthase [Candidatus Caldarchaeum sp.]MDW8435529.1 L-threonylcarbamoyladenylate synthase [Candidatus Caldarchaeum sp.]